MYRIHFLMHVRNVVKNSVVLVGLEAIYQKLIDSRNLKMHSTINQLNTQKNKENTENLRISSKQSKKAIENLSSIIRYFLLLITLNFLLYS